MAEIYKSNNNHHQLTENLLEEPLIDILRQHEPPLSDNEKRNEANKAYSIQLKLAIEEKHGKVKRSQIAFFDNMNHSIQKAQVRVDEIYAELDPALSKIEQDNQSSIYRLRTALKVAGMESSNNCDKDDNNQNGHNIDPADLPSFLQNRPRTKYTKRSGGGSSLYIIGGYFKKKNEIVFSILYGQSLLDYYIAQLY